MKKFHLHYRLVLNKMANNNVVKIQENLSKNSGVRQYIENPKVLIKKASKKTFILSLSFLIITGVLIYFAVNQTSKLSSELQKKQNLIYMANQQTQNGTELLRKWNAVSGNLEKVSNTLPPSNDLLGFLGTLEKIAAESGVTQSVKLNTQATANQKPVNLPGTTAVGKGSEVPFTVELKGQFPQFVNYLNLLSEAPYFTSVTTVAITGSSNINDEAQATFGMKVYTYD